VVLAVKGRLVTTEGEDDEPEAETEAQAKVEK
jgi:hypothetical protein